MKRDELTRAATNMFGSNINVMVLKKENVALFDSSGKIQRFPIQTGCYCHMWCSICKFDIMAAPYGYNWRVMNNGDGGWINWAFKGRFRRHGRGGKVVEFY